MSDQPREVGRPSKMFESLGPARDYLAGGYTIDGGVIPTVAGLACYLGVSRSTVNKWAVDDKGEGGFSDIVEGILSMQEFKLVNGGLKGDYNPTIAKLLLTKHGYSDKAEMAHEHTGKDGAPMQVVTMNPEDIKRVIENDDC